MDWTCSMHVEILKLYTSLVGDSKQTRSRETCELRWENNVKLNNLLGYYAMQ
jgi:hypothetical protein